MSRLAIEGTEELMVVTTFNEVDTDKVWGPDPAQFPAPDDKDVALLFGGYLGVPFGRANPVGFSDGPSGGNGGVANPDSIDHDYTVFVTGTGVPGGRLQIQPTATLPEFSAAPLGAYPMVLLPGQELVGQAAGAINNANQFVTMRNVWQCVLQESAAVSGFRFGNQWSLLNDGAAVVIPGPDGTTFNRRRIMAVNGAPGSFMVNLDDVSHQFGYYLQDSTAGNRLLQAETMSAGGIEALPFIDLLPGQSLKIITLTATNDVDPMVHASFVDFINEGKEIFDPEVIPNAPDPYDPTVPGPPPG